VPQLLAVVSLHKKQAATIFPLSKVSTFEPVADFRKWSANVLSLEIAKAY
jgi:patatin-like phospholipase/acyl hydrolase